jgi:hypothetical protein
MPAGRTRAFSAEADARGTNGATRSVKDTRRAVKTLVWGRRGEQADVFMIRCPMGVETSGCFFEEKAEMLER